MMTLKDIGMHLKECEAPDGFCPVCDIGRPLNARIAELERVRREALEEADLVQDELRAEIERLKEKSDNWSSTARELGANHIIEVATLRAEVERLTRERDILDINRKENARVIVELATSAEALDERCTLYRGVATDLRAENDRLRAMLVTVTDELERVTVQRWKDGDSVIVSTVREARAALKPKDRSE